MMTDRLINLPIHRRKATLPAWKRIAKPLVEAARTIEFLDAVWKGQYKPAQPAIKMRVLRSWVPNPEQVTFIETGTYRGDTVLALKETFGHLISIEIDSALHELAKSRTSKAQNVELILGDCVTELPVVLSRLEGRAAFWLDGHWSGGVTGRGAQDDPILVSLHQIAGHPRKDHFLFIDDARNFQGHNGTPDLVDVLLAVREINREYKILVLNDIVIAVPR